MRTASVRQFRDRATTLMKETEPVLITRRGKIAGFFLPAKGEEVPPQIKRDLFYMLTDEIRRTIRARGLTEEAVLAGFEEARTARRRR